MNIPDSKRWEKDHNAPHQCRYWKAGSYRKTPISEQMFEMAIIVIITAVGLGRSSTAYLKFSRMLNFQAAVGDIKCVFFDLQWPVNTQMDDAGFTVNPFDDLDSTTSSHSAG